MIGCECSTCRSTDPRDRRLRPSIFVEADDGTAVLVDAGPDLREQALTHRIRRVDAVLFTHGHADHILGMDDIRRFNVLQKRPMPCYGDARTIADVRQTFAYAFDPATQKGGGPAADRDVHDLRRVLRRPAGGRAGAALSRRAADSGAPLRRLRLL